MGDTEPVVPNTSKKKPKKTNNNDTTPGHRTCHTHHTWPLQPPLSDIMAWCFGET